MSAPARSPAFLPSSARRGREWRGLLLWLALACLPLAGCEQIYRQRIDQLRETAEAKASDGAYREAVAFYEAALDGEAESAMIHYNLGMLYDQHLDEPLGAIHHFQRYLDLAPEGVHAKDVHNMIEEDRLRVMTRYGNGATIPQREAVRLKNDNLALRRQVLELREELDALVQSRAELLKSLGRSAAPGGGQVQKPLVPGVRTYTVVQGDTLASISRKFYKTPNRWKRIQDANFNRMEGTAILQAGMVLMIP